jgi:hypothetical protein
VLDPVAVQSHHPGLADVLARQEHHHAVVGEQVGHLFRQVEVDVIAVGPVQPANGVDVFKLAHAVLQRGQALFDFAHHRLSLFWLYP